MVRRSSAAAIAARLSEWLHRENPLCSSLLNERVGNFIPVAVAMVCLGLMMAMSVTVSIPMGLCGVALIAMGSRMLRKEGSL